MQALSLCRNLLRLTLQQACLSLRRGQSTISPLSGRSLQPREAHEVYLFYEKSAINAQDRLREYDKSKEDRYTHSLSFQVVSIFNPHSNLLASLSSTDRMSFRLSDLEQATFPIVLSHEYSNIGIIFFFLLATKYCAVGFYDLDFLCFSNAERRSVAVYQTTFYCRRGWCWFWRSWTEVFPTGLYRKDTSTCFAWAKVLFCHTLSLVCSLWTRWVSKLSERMRSRLILHHRRVIPRTAPL